MHETIVFYFVPLIINDFFNTDSRIKSDVYSIFIKYGEMQFDDFSKYDCDLFNENQKAQVQAKQFPTDMKKAFELGKKLVNFN